MKTAVTIPDPLFHEVNDLAKRLRISRSELFRRAVRAYVRERAKDESVTENLNRVYAAYPEAFRLDPLLEEMQYASLPKEEW